MVEADKDGGVFVFEACLEQFLQHEPERGAANTDTDKKKEKKKTVACGWRPVS